MLGILADRRPGSELPATTQPRDEANEHGTSDRQSLQDHPDQQDVIFAETASTTTASTDVEIASANQQPILSPLSIVISGASSISSDINESRTRDGSRGGRAPEELDETNAFGAQSFITDFLASDGNVPEPFVAKFDVQTVIENGPHELMQGCKQREGKDRSETEFRWIHLPANNMYWVEVRETCPLI